MFFFVLSVDVCFYLYLVVHVCPIACFLFSFNDYLPMCRFISLPRLLPDLISSCYVSPSPFQSLSLPPSLSPLSLHLSLPNCLSFFLSPPVYLSIILSLVLSPYLSQVLSVILSLFTGPEEE